SVGGSRASISAVGAEGYVTPDGRRRLVIAKPRRPPFDAAFSRALDNRLQHLAETQAAEAAASADRSDDERRPPLQVQFAGGYRIAVETESLVRREAVFNTLGALALILPLLFGVFRSVWLVTVGALPSLLSALIVLGALGFSHASLTAAGTG